jgi:hypothetical protein
MPRNGEIGLEHMSKKVDSDKIEDIVGAKRHARAHWARAVSEEQTVYVLHSYRCLEDNEDLRDCEYSLALDNGIDVDAWPEDTPVVVKIYDNRIYPARIG